MPETITVWAVRLERGPLRETKGTLTLEADALVFRSADGSTDQRIPFADLRKTRRVVGSPVLIVAESANGEVVRTAFYFIQPPPLEPAGRTSRRKNRRQGATYLGSYNRTKKREIQEWERALRIAAQAARE